MAFIATPNGIEVVLEFTLGGQGVKNVLHFSTEGTIDLTFLTTLGTALIDAILGSDWWTLIASDQITLDDIKLTDIETDSGPSVIVTEGSSETLPQPGGFNGFSAPNNAALVVTERTDNRGRSYRGRTYLSGIPAGKTADSVTVVAPAATAAIGLLSDIADAGDAHDAQLSILSKRHNKVPRTSGVLTPVSQFAANVALDSQRRRLQGRGS